MFEAWSRNIRESFELAGQGEGPSCVSVVSGTESDRAYWQEHLAAIRREVFSRVADVPVYSVCESSPKGNFLGTLQAWAQVRRMSGGGPCASDVMLMSMVFGKGKRLSPFTQALGNRKPAFLTPLRSRLSDSYLNTADLSNLYANGWVSHLRAGGFRGVLVKWGDEAIIPGRLWAAGGDDFRGVDAVRFVWRTEPTETLAREKEWFIVDPASGLVRTLLPRQDLDAMRGRLGAFAGEECYAAVNLGSVAVTYDFLNLALEMFGADVLDPRLTADWDPYLWVAMFCEGESEWLAEKERESRLGKQGMRALEARYPDFYRRVAAFRRALESRNGRPLRVAALNFGPAFWVDIGLHVPLRRCLESLITDGEVGMASREVFGLPHERDRNGNIIIRSAVPDAADIRNSLIVDSVILDAGSVIRGGVVVGGRYRLLRMPEGGSALFSAADRARFLGPHGISFWSVTPEIEVAEGGRHATIFLPRGPLDFVSNEAISDYEGESYERPVLGNPLSFREAGEIMAGADGRALEERVERSRLGWLG